jgi:hypothetical protein
MTTLEFYEKVGHRAFSAPPRVTRLLTMPTPFKTA